MARLTLDLQSEMVGPDVHLMPMPGVECEDAAAQPHPFARCMNPPLAELLRSLWLDKRFVRGRGCELFDEKGRRYLDCIAAYGALPFGFNPKPIWESLMDVRRRGEPSCVQPSLLDPAGELAEQLLAIAPANMRYVTFTNSGAESIETAIKMCRAATGRAGILSTDNSFHGKTLGALSATGNPHYQHGFCAPAADFQRIAFGDAEALRQELAARPGYYAAFVVEPIQGEGGVVEPPHGYLRAVRDICKAAGVLLVLDEIQTGLGRTGTMFACQAEGIEPDVMTLAKALGGGLLPIGAVLASEAAYSETFALKHSSTFAASTLPCRAGLAALRLLTMKNQGLVRRVARYGDRLLKRLWDLQERYPQLIAEVRGRGFLLGIRFHVDRDLWPESLLGVAAEQELFTPLVASYLLNVEGVRVAPTLNGKSVIRIEPALTMTWGQCERLLLALERTLAVFASGDTGRVLRSIVDGADCNDVSVSPCLPVSSPAWVAVKPHAAERRFAFLLHPLDAQSVIDFDPSLAKLGDSLEDLTKSISGMLEPFVWTRGRIASWTGETVYGEFICLPRTAEEFAHMRRKEAMEYVRGAVRLAKSRGAQLVGLGAFTSIVTLGGSAVADEGVPVTSGNSYTAVAAAEACRRALSLVGQDMLHADPPTAAIVGATGAIGRAMTHLLAEDVGRLILVGNPESSPTKVRQRLVAVVADLAQSLLARQANGACFRLASIAHELIALAARMPLDLAVERLERSGRLIFSQDASGSAQEAQLVVTATSATGTVLQAADLRPDAVVCDVSRPANVSAEIARIRPDVLVIDGGVIAVPSGSVLANCGLGAGLVYACMAETMMLTLAGHLRNTSIGTDLNAETLDQLRTLADQHGFDVARLRSFGRPLEDTAFRRLLAS